MFRLYPTVSNENTRVDAATLQTRLDDAELQLRQQRFKHKEKEDKIIALTTDLKSQEELLKSYEMQLVSFDTKVMSLSEQLEHAQLQNKDLLQLKDENESLKKSMQALNSIQKLLNSTIEEVDQMLQGCSDVRTLATFVTALKRTLWESESKQNEIKSLLHEVNKKLSLERNDSAKLQKIILQLETKLHGVRTQYEILKKDRDLEQQVKEEEKRMNDVMQSSPSDLNAARLKAASTTSLEPFTPIRLPRPPYALPLNIQSSANPFLNTIQNSLMEIKSLDTSPWDMSFGGLGGHSSRSTSKSSIPKKTTKRKRKQPYTSASQEVIKMLNKIKYK